MFRNHLPTSNNIVKRNDRLDAHCALCVVWKDANHVFFRYPFRAFCGVQSVKLRGCIGI